MERGTEIALAEELLELKASGKHFLDEAATTSPVDHYLSEQRFAEERTKLLMVQPHAVAHVSELPEPGSFLRRDLFGQPVLLARDKQGDVRAFLNVCRHRGAQLVAEESGCQHKFSCPYHAWTYSSAGKLLAAPHFKEGFPGAEKSDFSLTTLPCREAYGFVWVVPTVGLDAPLHGYLDEMGDELGELDVGSLDIAVEDTIICDANWKVLIEGGIESYHFKVAHRDTIGPYFEDNLSSYQSYGKHMRSVLPRASMSEVFPNLPQDQWRLRDHANIIYTMFPTSQMLVQQDHLIWIRSTPISAGKTELRLATMVPRSGHYGEGKGQAYWERNHAITMNTLKEDFEIGEGIQRGLASGANSELNFGRFEGALEVFKQTVNELVDA